MTGLRRQSGFLAAALAALPLFARAQETPPVRRIAPDQFPAYQNSGTPEQPQLPAVAAPTDEHPFGSCEKDSREWQNCLRLTAELTDRLLDRTTLRILVAASGGEKSAGRQRSFSRALDEAQRRYRALRDYECGQLLIYAPREERATYDRRMICLINRDRARMRELETRYGAADAGAD
ncbi:lysozyme inhibitor LprI family protein [Terrarubrum flagellatum]|uniref:lysozyme inhibitor LprI family protein n=1 Tax=Terrirubrum flagellatum TaxID=2895980 RepID=UPI0031455329